MSSPSIMPPISLATAGMRKPEAPPPFRFLFHSFSGTLHFWRAEAPPSFVQLRLDRAERLA
ncbi:hypothetical protein CXU10_06025 [Akkermansia muciniphila]|nr:hypothetical protein CXU10_06025 [Akkermansia muciniphila]